MTANDIRSQFLNYFRQQQHTVVASDTLVPKDDPTVLFTTAGMQQFKRQFLGQNIDYRRAASSQKCLRTDDLDKVGQTPFHHTFFEMLGNFSFGDYFKREAIAWAWEFLTKELGIPSEKLWVSVYEDDKEAEKIWLETVRLPPARLVRLGDKSNFWPSEAKTKGPNGPCGPCSEIFFDYGPKVGCQKRDCSPACDCGRFAEIWNLVFTQFNRKEDGTLEPLPNKNIDTGMGLERLTAVIQGKGNNFETDLFEKILSAIGRLISNKIGQREKYLIADHIRAIVFGISDGIVPSNENRGYVIKRLIIDAADLAFQFAAPQPVIHQLVASVVDTMADAYPELRQKQKDVSEIIRRVEEAYVVVRKERIPELKRRAEKGDDLGQLFFVYRDTYGLTLSTIKKALGDLHLSHETLAKAEERFHELMEEQKARSRSSSKMTGDVFTHLDLNLNVAKTVFFGYTQEKTTATILKIFIGKEEVLEVKAGQEAKIILDQTPFYAEAGGQIGDTGEIAKDGSIFQVANTQKISDIFLHEGTVKKGSLKVNDSVHAQIDSQRRLAIMRNHTATHLLQAALRRVLGDHVKQQGSLVTDERLRFDFTHPKGVSVEEIEKIERMVNGIIISGEVVKRENLSLEEARRKGALAFFAEKYGEVVNVVSVGNHSSEFCGGTHLASVGQIGLFKIVNESAIAQGIRRIEAKTGSGALEYVMQKEKQLDAIAQLLKVPADEVASRLGLQIKKLKETEKELERLRYDAIRRSLDDLIAKAVSVNDSKIISHVFKNISTDLLRKVADDLKQKVKSAVIILACDNAPDVLILMAVTDNLVSKGIEAHKLIDQVAALIKGSGGGRPQMAQAGSKEGQHLNQAIEKAVQLAKERM